MTTLETIRVGLGARSYDVVVGSAGLARAGELIAPLLKRARVAIVTDETVAGLHLKTLGAALDGAGIAHEAIVLPPGEQTKSFVHLEKVCRTLLAARLERGDLVIALGGGVIGDLVGLAAGLVRRGMGFVQIPTTLLAQVDSSVGGKTAINAPEGKNLIGLFHQPRLVIADIDVLATLPERELKAGYAEVVKYGLIGDAGFFDWLDGAGARLLRGDTAALTRAVATSVRAKAGVVERDETETGERALLNLGHTFGHALEAATGFSNRLLHGEGVAIGMKLAFDLSAALGACDGQVPGRVATHFARIGLPWRLADIPGARPPTDELLHHMAQDKKVEAGRLTFILAHGIGDAFIAKDVDAEAVRRVLDTAE
ncbi:MAG: 3-dehydroquinate synthase [Alphaproteobacteria bacterium]|nr:3-dehydroquinate synthase [Alphaproteobacteria bacterium]